MNTKTLILVLIFAGMVAYGGYYMGNKNKSLEQIPVSVTSSPTPYTATGTVAPTADETETLKAAVRQGLITKHGQSAGSMTITVSLVQGDYAKGMASEQGGGGIWFAARVNGSWKLVWDGNGIITCADIAPYPNFPNTMIPECWNETTKKSVTR